MNQELKRLESWEGGFVKYAFGNDDESILATLVQDTKFADEMQIRISVSGERFSVPGHKSIMGKWTAEEFQKQIEKQLKRRFPKECDMCGYPHKERPKSFCEALQNHTMNDPKVKSQTVKDILGPDLVASLASKGIGI